MWLSGVAFAESDANGVGCAPTCLLFSIIVLSVFPLLLLSAGLCNEAPSPTTVLEEEEPTALSSSAV